MPRHARIDASGALQHIIVRGIERRPIFADDLDRDAFVIRLGRLLRESATPCYAWALMPNHVHLLLRTGRVPLASVMRRLLTGHAVTFNLRHKRHGPLFQNRYKSILCQEDPYLLELVRYIHLNPLRGTAVRDLDELDRYPYAGHSVLMGRRPSDWQDIGSVLGHFGRRVGVARRAYRAFVAEGIARGRRPELVGGGLIRSLGGWAAAERLGRGEIRRKGDERILGDSAFVLDVLHATEERLTQRTTVQRQGFDLERLARIAATRFSLKPDELYSSSKRPELVKARSLLCYWAIRELGLTATAVARTLGVTQPAVSIAVHRGEAIATSQGLRLVEGRIL
jgi:REP element-mobilizing transposase RayT